MVRPHERGDGDRGLSRLHDELESTFERLWREFGRGEFPLMGRPAAEWPAIDVAEDEKAVTVRADVPGMEAKDLDVEVSGNQLTIRGHREDEWSKTEGGIHRQERRSGSFSRTVSLPAYVDASKIEARYDKGTLTVVAPKTRGQGPKRVQVSG